VRATSKLFKTKNRPEAGFDILKKLKYCNGAKSKLMQIFENWILELICYLDFVI
jgi:hypothetical protein